MLDKEALVRSGMVEQIKREITILKQVRDPLSQEALLPAGAVWVLPTRCPVPACQRVRLSITLPLRAQLHTTARAAYL